MTSKIRNPASGIRVGFPSVSPVVRWLPIRPLWVLRYETPPRLRANRTSLDFFTVAVEPAEVRNSDSALRMVNKCALNEVSRVVFDGF